MDIVPAAQQALSVLGSVDSVSRLANVVRQVGDTASWLSGARDRIRDIRRTSADLNRRIRVHEARNSPSGHRAVMPRARRTYRPKYYRKYPRSNKPTDSRPSPWVIPRGNSLASCIGKELKHVYTAFTSDSSNFDSNTGFYHLVKSSGTTNLQTIVQIPQGDTPFTREGRACCVRWIKITGEICKDEGQALATGAITDTRCKLALVLDRQNSKTGPPISTGGTPDDRLTGIYDQIAGRSAVDYPADIYGKDRFKVLKSKEFVMPIRTITEQAAGSYDYPKVVRKFTWFIRPKDLPIIYEGSAGSIDQIVSNNLFLMFAFDKQDVGLGGVVDVAFTD